MVLFCGVCFGFCQAEDGLRALCILGSHYPSELYLSLFLHSHLCSLCGLHILSMGQWPFVASGYHGE